MLGDGRARLGRRRRAHRLPRPATSSAPSKGDFVLTVDPQLCGGADVRVVIEAKDRGLLVARRCARSSTDAQAQPRRRSGDGRLHARRTRRAASRRSTCASATSSASSTRTSPDEATLGAAVRLARLLAVATLTAAQENEIDAGRVAADRDRHQGRARRRPAPQDAADLDRQQRRRRSRPASTGCGTRFWRASPKRRPQLQAPGRRLTLGRQPASNALDQPSLRHSDHHEHRPDERRYGDERRRPARPAASARRSRAPAGSRRTGRTARAGASASTVGRTSAPSASAPLIDSPIGGSSSGSRPRPQNTANVVNAVRA